MPSFDIVSRTDLAEVDNAINGMVREMRQRFDFKGSKCSIERKEDTLTILADDEMKLRQMHELIKTYFTRRNVPTGALEYKTPEKASGDSLRQTVEIRQGIDAELGKKITKAVKESKLKVTAKIEGNEVRVAGAKKDDLQAAIALVKGLKLEKPLQYINFRD
ncbi:MAG: YajQ family cyclic di-GMP-binding protein [SAR202 cluster bacterium]|nr:YajQ family cyclic di-GMP-binding protein [SAR202 cluster bacterium]